MKRNRIQNFTLLLCFCTSIIGVAQTPKADIDSITEDSYRRMLERRSVEQESDSIMISHHRAVLQEPKKKEWQWYYYLAGILIFFLILGFLWYLRPVTKTDGRPKNKDS